MDLISFDASILKELEAFVTSLSAVFTESNASTILGERSPLRHAQ